MGMAGFGRDAAIQRLADLGHHHQIVDAPRAYGSEQLFPSGRETRAPPPK
jgi:hypothetical protein